MNAVGAIREVILADSITTALLATVTSVYPVIVPQGLEYPAVTLAIGEDRPETYKWTPTAEKERCEMVVGIWAKTHDEVQKIDTALRSAIDGFIGGVTTSDDVYHYIHDTAYQNRRDDYDIENKLFYRSVFYRVIIHRDVPPIPIGTPYVSQSQAWFDSLPEYDSDESAIADGMSVGQVYLTADNHMTETGGLPKQIRG